MDKIHIWQPGEGDRHGVRQIFRQRMEKLYSGWSDEYDQQWDNNSFLFALESNGEYQATCRIAIKRYHEITFATSMEKAEIKSYNINGFKNICGEANMFSFTSIAALKKLSYYITAWLIENEFDFLFTCYDTDNPLTKRVFTRTLKFSIVEDGILIYSGFTSKKKNRAVKWQVVVNERDSVHFILELLSENIEDVYETGKYPSLKEWISTISN